MMGGFYWICDPPNGIARDVYTLIFSGNLIRNEVNIINCGVEENVSNMFWLQREKERWEKRGIRAEIVPVDDKGTTMYILVREGNI